MLFAIDRINNDSSLLPDIKLGAIALDTCSSDSYALNQSLEFIRASINTVESSAFQCTDGSMPRPKYGMKVISGVVGGSYSEVSLQVANLLRLFRIPQARVLVDIVQTFNWSYVSIVSSEGQYGDSGMKAFMGESAARNICIAINEKVPHSATWGHFDAIFSSLLKKPNARGVVLFVRMEDARGILEAAKRANNINFFTWIGSDGWGKEEKLVEGLEEVAEGALTVELGTTNVPGLRPVHEVPAARE
ncbi:Metabotropic glutamate receptor [Halotydeus destructor]|nr:Metabotropic glutamate receptor [Halotydeus destructor]